MQLIVPTGLGREADDHQCSGDGDPAPIKSVRHAMANTTRLPTPSTATNGDGVLQFAKAVEDRVNPHG
jgi:hypothetical protein